MRDKPASAKSNRSPPTQIKVFEENDIIREKLDTSGSRNTKPNLGFFNIRKLHSRKRTNHTNANRQITPLQKDSRSSSANNREIKIEQIEILKEELKITWDNFAIPEQHRNLFNLCLANTSKLQSSIKIAREIDRIEKEKANIVAVMACVRTREKLLEETAVKVEQNPKQNLVNFIKLIEVLRDITLQCIEHIYMWKQEFFAEENFIYNDQIYFEKLKSDTDFLAVSSLNRHFNFYKSDPLFTGPTTPKLFRKQKSYIIPLGHKQSPRISKALEILGFTPIKPAKIVSAVVTSNATLSDIDHTRLDKSQIFVTDLQTVLEFKKENQEISLQILNLFVETEISRKLEVFVAESFREIIAASLTLYSSSILDRVINEVLGELIPAVAKQSHTEVTDSEYIDIRNLIVNEVMEEQMMAITCKETELLLSALLGEIVIGGIELFQIALGTIDEENTENLSIVAIVADILIEEFLTEDWVEELAEVELVQEKMENVWKDMPSHIQKEIYLHQKPKILYRIYEMVYFGMLNEFVGKLWLENLATSVYMSESGREEMSDDDIFVLRDPNAIVEEKKPQLFRVIRKK